MSWNAKNDLSNTASQHAMMASSSCTCCCATWQIGMCGDKTAGCPGGPSGRAPCAPGRAGCPCPPVPGQPSQLAGRLVWAVWLSGGVSLSWGHGLAPFRPSVPFPVPTTTFWGDPIRLSLGLLLESKEARHGQLPDSQTVPKQKGNSQRIPSISQAVNPAGWPSTFPVQSTSSALFLVL